MSFATVQRVNIKGVSACVPKQQESNANYDWISEKERAKLIKTTGVEHRRIAASEVTAADLSFKAAEALIEQLQWEKNDINVLVNVTQSPDYLIPSTAIILQNRLGLSTNCIAFDVNLGCSGYVYGLFTIAKMLDGMNLKKGLLLVGDKSSRPVNFKDKSSYPLFGDAGSATALMFDEDAQPMHFKMNSDGKGYEAIIIRSGGSRQPVTTENLLRKKISDGIERAANELELNGMDVFNFATTKVPAQIKLLLTQADCNIESIDYFVFHQANKLMNELIRKKIKVKPEKVPYTLKDFGNTSSASIPLTMVYQLKNYLKQKQKVLLSGFGVGLSWASVIVETENLIIPELIEI